MITLQAYPSALSLSDSLSVGFVATWTKNAPAYKELGLEKDDEISIVFVPESAALEIWQFVFDREYDGKDGAIGLLAISSDHNTHEATVGVSKDDFEYLRDHFFDLARHDARLTTGLFLAAAEQTKLGAASPFGIRPRISLVLEGTDK